MLTYDKGIDHTFTGIEQSSSYTKWYHLQPYIETNDYFLHRALSTVETKRRIRTVDNAIKKCCAII